MKTSVHITSLFYLLATALLVAGSVALRFSYADGVYLYIASGVLLLFGGAWELSLSLAPPQPDHDSRPHSSTSPCCSSCSPPPPSSPFSASCQLYLRVIIALLLFAGGLCLEAAALFYLPGSSLTILLLAAIAMCLAACFFFLAALLHLLHLLQLRPLRFPRAAVDAAQQLLWMLGAALLLAGAVLNALQAAAQMAPDALDLWLTAGVLWLIAAAARALLNCFGPRYLPRPADVDSMQPLFYHSNPNPGH